MAQENYNRHLLAQDIYNGAKTFTTSGTKTVREDNSDTKSRQQHLLAKENYKRNLLAQDIYNRETKKKHGASENQKETYGAQKLSTITTGPRH